jgi:hypothetical protein
VTIVETPPLRGGPPLFDEATNSVPDVIEGESITAKPSKGTAAPQSMKSFTAGRWSGASQLFWRGGDVGETLEIELQVDKEAEYTLESVFTIAPDYAIVELTLDGKPLGEPIDLYDSAKVSTSGVLEHQVGKLAAGPHKLGIRITGTNPAAKPSKFVGLDFVKLFRKR